METATVTLPDGTTKTIRLFEWKEKEWYKRGMAKNREKSKQRITCECGNEISFGSKSGHIHTQKHKQLMRSLEKNKITN
jgi:hypothetical protein